MTTTLVILAFFTAPALVFFILWRVASSRNKALTTRIAEKEAEAERAKQEAAATVRAANDAAKLRVAEAQKLIDQEHVALRQEEARIRSHYEEESRRFMSEMNLALQKARDDSAALQRYASLVDAETETKRLLAEAATEAQALRAEAASLLETAQLAAKAERATASRKASELHAQADKLLEHATQKAAKIIDDAHKQAEKIAGDAYLALREKDHLQEAIKAVRNLVEGYGDRYVVPTHSIIDDLAAGYGHTDAGRRLEIARMQSKRMVTEQIAATCDYVEANRRETAVRFVVDAFNGRVDALLTEAETTNIGTLEQQIRDAFNIVNLNGEAFRNARILPAYLDARLEELKWAVATYELRQREREEQRRIKEQIREEERARREYERAIREAQDEEAKLQRALAKAKSEAEQATAQQRQKLEEEIALLTQKLVEAEEKNQRALSMAQQTKKGNVYIISNIGSFGEQVFKIGMTRRLEPMDRIWELSDASVPFDFDVHALIPCDDAPALEGALHDAFSDHRINKINQRKEFFRVPLEQIREIVASRGIEASFTLLAEAQEYRETQKLNSMTPEERQRYTASRAIESITVTSNDETSVPPASDLNPAR
ncbi:MAG: DUF4041 domain-containing protein [Candidatus Didemnitutus sp.]|nr:DUF4041 domain-containing protein [Candidatus Didemnitutus sp.]